MLWRHIGLLCISWNNRKRFCNNNTYTFPLPVGKHISSVTSYLLPTDRELIVVPLMYGSVRLQIHFTPKAGERCKVDTQHFSKGFRRVCYVSL
jgi:hypothetical protein